MNQKKLEEYRYDMQVPDFNSVVGEKKKTTWKERLFGGGWYQE